MTRTSRFGFTSPLPLIIFIIITFGFRFPFLLTGLRSRVLFWSVFTLRAEPFPLWDSSQGRIQTSEVVRVVTLESPSSIAPIITKQANYTLSHCNAESSSPSSVLHTTHAGGGFTSIGCLGKSDSLELGFARKKVVFWPAAMLTKDVSLNVKNGKPWSSYLKTSIPLNGLFFVGLVKLLGSFGPIPSSSSRRSDRSKNIQAVPHTVCGILAPPHSHDTTVIIIC